MGQGGPRAPDEHLLRASRYGQVSHHLDHQSTAGHRVAQVGGAIAAALADTGARVLLVQADLHETAQPPLLDEQGEESAGLAAYLSGATPAESAIWRDTSSGVDVVPAGFEPTNADDLLHSEAFATLLDDVAKRYEFVLVTTPPRLAARTPPLSPLVATARCWSSPPARRSLSCSPRETQLQRVDAHVLGVGSPGLRTGIGQEASPDVAALARSLGCRPRPCR